MRGEIVADEDWLHICHKFDRHLHTLVIIHERDEGADMVWSEYTGLRNAITGIKKRLPRVRSELGDDTLRLFAERYLREARIIQRLLDAHDPSGPVDEDILRAVCADIHTLYSL